MIFLHHFGKEFVWSVDKVSTKDFRGVDEVFGGESCKFVCRSFMIEMLGVLIDKDIKNDLETMLEIKSIRVEVKVFINF